jgi:signal transduction histidine kinase
MDVDIARPVTGEMRAAVLPIGYEAIRAGAVGRMFARSPKLALLVFEPTMAGMCLWVIFTAGENWRRVTAIVLLAALVAMNFNLLRAQNVTITKTVRWLIGISLVALTGGPLSPIAPFLLISSLSFPTLFGCNPAWVMTSVSIGALWIMTAAGVHSANAMIHAGCLSTLLVGAQFIGMWIREISDDILTTSLQARDELLGTYGDRMRELTNLQGALANELKNPLAAIKGLAGLMALEPARAGERLQVLQKEVARMQRIVDELLDFSRPLTPIRPKATPVRALFADVVKLHEGLAGQKQLTLDWSAPERTELVGDPRKLKQMLMNLVANAIEASPAGATVELRAQQEGEQVVLGVLDRGAGMSDELLARAAEPGVSTKDNGAGLGLTIVRSLAAQHGGTLQLANRDGGGLEARLQLPLLCPGQRAVAAANASASACSAHS